MTSKMDPANAVTYGAFVVAAYEMYEPGVLNPPPGPNFPNDYELVATIQMSDSSSLADRQFYGFIALAKIGPAELVLALRGTEDLIEWWNDFHWALTPFDRVTGAGSVAVGFYDVYKTMGTMTPGQGAAESIASASIAADVARIFREAAALDAADAAPSFMTGHSLGAGLLTMLILDMMTNEKPATLPSVYTFASPRVGDAEFAAAYDALFSGSSSSAGSLRIANVFDVVPMFPIDPPYRHVQSEMLIDSYGKAYFSIACNHALNTYLHVLAPAWPLTGCAPTMLDARRRVLHTL